MFQNFLQFFQFISKLLHGLERFLKILPKIYLKNKYEYFEIRNLKQFCSLILGLDVSRSVIYTVKLSHHDGRNLQIQYFCFNIDINNIDISFVRVLTVFAELYNFLTVWHSSALTVHAELCSLVLTVNCCKIEKLLTAVQSCSSFSSTAKFTVKYSLTRVTYLRFLDALFGTVYW